MTTPQDQPQYPGQFQGNFNMAPPPMAPPAARPGRVLGIVGFIVAFPFSVVGLIISIIAKVQSRRAGEPNGFATAGIIVGAVLFVIQIGLIVLLVVVFANLANECHSLGQGVHEVGGVTYNCG